MLVKNKGYIYKPQTHPFAVALANDNGKQFK